MPEPMIRAADHLARWADDYADQASAAEREPGKTYADAADLWTASAVLDDAATRLRAIDGDPIDADPIDITPEPVAEPDEVPFLAVGADELRGAAFVEPGDFARCPGGGEAHELKASTNLDTGEPGTLAAYTCPVHERTVLASVGGHALPGVTVVEPPSRARIDARCHK